MEKDKTYDIRQRKSLLVGCDNGTLYQKLVFTFRIEGRFFLQGL